MKVVPVRDNILVEFLIDSKKGLIELPHEHKQSSRRAMILDMGPQANTFKVGDIILLSWYSGIDIDLPDTPYSSEVKLIREEQILARVSD